MNATVLEMNKEANDRKYFIDAKFPLGIEPCRRSYRLNIVECV